MVRMKPQRIQKISETMKQECSRKRGRPQLRWEDYAKTDPRKAEEEEKWRKSQQQGAMGEKVTKVAVRRGDE